MADRIVVMRGGHVEQIGTPMELYDDPQSLFVAEFIGSPTMSRIPGRIDGGVFVASGGEPVAEVDGRLARGHGDVVCCVRPHEIELGETGAPARVVVVEPTGADTQVVARLGETPVVCVTRERISLGPGDPVRLGFDPDTLFFFDPETGRRIDSKRSVRDTE